MSKLKMKLLKVTKLQMYNIINKDLPKDGMWSPKGGNIESGHIRLPS